MNKVKKIRKLELLNFEGPVLMAHRIKNIFVITDQWKEVVDVFIGQEIEDFINGELPIIDSRGKLWIYTNEHSNAKPTKEKIDQFLND